MNMNTNDQLESILCGDGEAVCPRCKQVVDAGEMMGERCSDCAEQETEPPTLEICTNTEWLRESWLDLSGVSEHNRNDAATEAHNRLDRALNDAGYETKHPGGLRSLFHQWSGANTFTWKYGPIGTFDTLTVEQQDAIIEIVGEVEDKIKEEFKRTPQEELQDAEDLDDLFRLMKEYGHDEEIDWTELPTFGGPDIQHTVLIWSWDKYRKIVGACADDLAIVDRDDLEED